MSISGKMFEGLAGQTALVTGASSGLGRRFAITLAAAGVKVAIGARRRDKLDTLVAEIEAAGGKAMAVTLDMAKAETFATLVDEIEAATGTISILVNNAGRGDGYRAIDLPLDVIDDMLAINLRGPFVLSCEIARRLIAARRPGRVVNIASIGAFNYSAATAAAALYCVTKSAIVRVTEVLAMEWAEHGINVNAIAPGFFLSEMSEAHFRICGDQIIQAMPRKRIGQSENLDSTLLYLVAPASEMVTGTCIKVDDGQMSR